MAKVSKSNLIQDKPDAPLNLGKRPRLHENLIQLFLLACGLLSILTTVGIIWVLLQEALGFFNRELWENSNRNISHAIDAEQTSFRTSREGRAPHTGQTIRLGGEGGEILLLERYEANEISISINGTGAGFTTLCAGDADIASASRAIEADELTACQSNSIEPLAFPIATDALVVVVNSTNTMVQDATLEELALIFGTAANWSDIRPEWPNEPIMRFMPATDSGSFDFFVDKVYGGDESLLVGQDASRISSREIIVSQDDKQLSRGVSENPYAVAFFGYAYYQQNQASLHVLSISGIAPSPEESYPLSRPLFLYTSAQALEKPQVAAFMQYILQNAPELVAAAGYFPPADDAPGADRQLFLETTGQMVALVNGDSFFPPLSFETLEGNIRVVGSSTVAPIMQAAQAGFYAAGFEPIAYVMRGYEESQANAYPASSVIETGKKVSLWEFFTGTVWQPAIGSFGILPLIYGTVATSLIAILVALPLGMGAAIYLSEYAPENVRKTVKPILEILAGIPTVVYGYFALSFMTPFLQSIFGTSTVQIYNSASPGIVIGILLVPLISSMSEDALSAVPRGLREASYGLGATKLETTMKVVIPAALSGILAAFIIAISRAIGETMIVAIAAGSGPQNNIPNLIGTRGPGILLEPAETMTGHIARISGGDLSYASIDYSSIFAIGLLLFVLTFALNLINNAIIRRFREAY
jgi:phosphate transport system permease protein